MLLHQAAVFAVLNGKRVQAAVFAVLNGKRVQNVPLISTILVSINVLFSGDLVA
jgi:hypothetical protein